MKVGLVLEGGSRKCMFSAGVLDALLEERVEFSYVAGVSGGAHGALNFLSAQKGRLHKLLYPSKARSGKRAHRVFDGIRKEFHIMTYEYSYDKSDPFDFKAFFDSSIECEIGMTCAESGKIEFHSEKGDERRLLDLVGASCSLPLLFPLARMNGKHYADGCISDSIPYDRAFEKGCDKVFVISTKVPGDRATDFSKYRPILSPLYRRRFPEYFELLMNRFAVYQEQFARMERLQDEGTVLVFKPEIPLCDLFETKPERLEHSYRHGYDYARRRMRELKKFMELEK